MKSLAAPLAISLLLVAMFIFPTIQQAHATGSIVQATGNPGVCTASCSATFGSSVTSGNFIVAFLQANAGAAVTCGSISVNSITDTLASTFTLVVTDCIQTADVNSFLYVAKLTSSGTDQVNIAFSGTVFAGGGQLEIFEISGAPAFNYLSANGHSISTTAAGTVNFISLPSSYFAISAITTGTSTCSTAGGGQTRYAFLGGANCWFNVGAGIGSTSVGYGIEPSLTNPTQFAWTAAQADWSEVGIVFAVTTQTSTVVPCTAFQLQCWLYPMFVFGVYMILIVGTARLLDVPQRDYTGHLLEGFSLAGMVCVIFGILNVMVPLMITVLQVVRALRE